MGRYLETVEVEPGAEPVASVIWMHGLGADGHDFEPVVPELVRPGDRPLRFIFPHAPVRPVTLNAGYEMRAWYDILDLDRGSKQDEAGVRESAAAIGALIQRENERGIPTNRIFLAGFSQGGAMALYAGLRYPQPLAGIIGLSCYMVMGSKLDAERSPANQSAPIFMAHGSYDPVLDFSLGDETRQMLQARGYQVEFHSYPMPHSVCPEEIAAISEWLRKVAKNT